MNTGDSAYLDISASAYFTVETLVRLVASSADRPHTAESLAQSIARSVSYTEGLLVDLSDAGLVQTAQDPGGGYYLARPADRITVAEIFRVFDEPDASDRQLGSLSTLLYADINALRGTDLLWGRSAVTSINFWRASPSPTSCPLPTGRHRRTMRMTRWL